MKARKVKSSSKAAKTAPRKATPPRKLAKGRKPAPKIHKYPGRAKAPAGPDREKAERADAKLARASDAKERVVEVEDDEAPDVQEPVEAAEPEGVEEAPPKRPAPPSPPPAPRGIAARLAAAAASANSGGDDEPVIATKKPAPKGGVAWEDWDDEDDPKAKPASPPGNGAAPKRSEEPVLVAPKPQVAAAGDGMEVVAKGASKFSAADIELLRASIKVKGSAQVVEGINLDELKWDHEGLLPCVAQDRRTGAVLQLGHMNKETLTNSLRAKQMQYYDRARGKVVEKGEGSGHPQRLVAMKVDCDKDALLALVDQEGPCCHRDTGTCWTDGRAIPIAGYLGDLDRGLEQQVKKPDPAHPYAKHLAEPIEALRRFVADANDIAQVVQGKTKASLEQEAADLLQALLVTCRAKGVGLDRIVTDLYARHMAQQLK